MKIQQSAEDYLETILMLSYRKPMIRSIDVVNELGYSKPSVPREVAVEDACRIEHVISPQSFEAIKEFAAAHLAKIEKANRTDEPEK